MNPIRLVSGAIALPAHAAAAVIGTSVGVATTGARALARVIERASGSDPVVPGPWLDEQPPSSDVDSILGTRTPQATPESITDPITEPTTEPTAGAAPARKAPGTNAAAKKAAAKKAPARKAAARKAPARKAAPQGAKKAAKKAAKKGAKKAPSKQAAVLAPALGLSEAEVESRVDAQGDTAADEVTTPSGIPAAGTGVNPDTTDTDLHQPGTEPLVDPATVKSVASEAAVLRRAADTDKG